MIKPTVCINLPARLATQEEFINYYYARELEKIRQENIYRDKVAQLSKMNFINQLEFHKDHKGSYNHPIYKAWTDVYSEKAINRAYGIEFRMYHLMNTIVKVVRRKNSAKTKLAKRARRAERLLAKSDDE